MESSERLLDIVVEPFVNLRIERFLNELPATLRLLKVIYDTRKIPSRSLCDTFCESHDPTNREYLGFGVDTHYRSAIFYASDEQRKQAQESKIRRQMRLNKRIVTKIIPLDYSDFFLAENQYQKYHLQRNRNLCGSLILRSTGQFVDSTTETRMN